MDTSLIDGVNMVKRLQAILPAYLSVLGEDPDYIFGDIVKDIIRLSRRIANDLLDSETGAASAERQKIIKFAAQVGDYFTMSRAINLFSREKNEFIKEQIAESLGEYGPIEKTFVPIVKAQIDYMKQTTINAYVPGLLDKAFKKIEETAAVDD